MKGFCFFILFLFSSILLKGQCLTDLKKLLPDRNTTKELRTVGLDVGGEYMVVANSWDDTTRYFKSGAAYIFKRSPAGWNYLALLTPSNPASELKFGSSVTIDSLGETVAITSYGSMPNVLSEVYVFQKSPSEWGSMIETDRIKLPDTTSNITSLKLNKDGTHLIVGLAFQNVGHGIVFMYERANRSQFFSQTSPQSIAPAGTPFGFGIDVDVDKSYLAVGSQWEDNGSSAGAIAIYLNDKSKNYPLVTKLQGDANSVPFGWNFEMKDNLIITSGVSSFNSTVEGALYFFDKKKNQSWAESVTRTVVSLPDWNSGIEIIDSTTIAYATARDFKVPNNYTTTTLGLIRTIHKNSFSWANPTTDTLFQELLPAGYLTYRNFGTAIEWNGSQLVVAPTLSPTNTFVANSLLSLTKTNGVWGSMTKVTLPAKNSNDFQFGFSLSKSPSGDLIIGSPQDSEIAPNAGAVEIYNKSGADWIRTGKILPPSNSLADLFFGSSVACSDSMMAIGSIYHQVKGAVFLYKRNGPNWSSNKLKQIVLAPPSFESYFGSSVAINSKILAVSGVGPSTNNNSLAIFENNGSDYSLIQEVSFKDYWGHGQNTKIFIRSDSIFVGIGGLPDIGGGVFILTKDPLTKQWGIVSFFDFVLGSFKDFGPFNFAELSLEVSDNHVFIGVPGIDRGGVPGVGSVYVFSKLPGTNWPAGKISSSSVIYPKDTLAYGYFGYSISNIENTLCVGAPGSEYITKVYNNSYFNVPRNVAGATYIFTSQDYSWKNTTQLLKLQGTEYNAALSDRTGMAVASDKDFYFSGAPYENNDHGSQAGAVYTIPTPPLVKLLPPICEGSPPQQLFGYPFGGTWSGQGLVAGSNGVFDPNLVGPGKYLLSYKTPNCAYEGKLLVEVIANPAIQLLTPADLSICPTNPPTIKIQPIDSVTYQWYYRSLNNYATTLIAGQTQPQLTVGLSGYYYCLVTKGTCSFPSASVTVQYETPSASIGPQSVVCDITKTLALTASPSGGTWSGQGIINSSLGTFSPSSLSNGKHPVTYTFKSVNGCNYTLADTVLIDAIPKQTLSKVPGDFCLTGLVSLKVDPIAPLLSYQWNFSQDISSTPSMIDNVNQQQRTFVEAGYYQVVVSNTNCTTTTDILKVGLDNDLPITLTPSDSLISVCMMSSTTLKAAVLREDANFEWYYKEVSKGDSVIAGGEATIITTKSGYYKVKALFGFCESTSRWQHVKFLPSDSLWVPNVFTPNGDSNNDVFKVKTTLSNYEMLILNRYGQEIFSAPGSSSPWNGGDNPAGVYYWYVEYFDCAGKEKVQKGFVQLIR